MYVCMYVLHTLHFWSVGFKNEYNAIWATVLNLCYKTMFSKLSYNFLSNGVKSLLKKLTEVFMLSSVSF
jgi:hypothetical protein